MRAILWTRFVHLKSTYKIYLLMMVLPLVFAFAFSFQNVESSISIPIVNEDRSASSEEFLKKIDGLSAYSVQDVNRSQLFELIREGDAELGMIIPENFFANLNENQDHELEIVNIKASPSIESFKNVLSNLIEVEQYNQQAVSESLQLYKEMDPDYERTEQVKERLYSTLNEKWSNTLPVEVNSINSGDQQFLYDHKLQTFFGFVLFFSMYTIIFSVGEILNDKKHGVWNRVIISPVNKLQLYLGNMVYSYVLSFTQVILLVLIGKYVMNVNMEGNFIILLCIIAIYVFTIMALGMLLVSFVYSTQQLHAIVPIVAVSSAMLGGAFWPIEIVTSKALLLLSKIIPISYAMSSIKEIILYGKGWEAVWLPGGILLLIGLVLLGLGMQFIERKAD